MNRTETAVLLAYAAARDSRKADPAAVEAWYEDVGDLTLEDCKAAVRHHFQTSDEYLMPVHVRSLVKVIRAERVRAAGDLTGRVPLEISSMEDGLEQQEAERAWLREATRRIGDGQLVDDVAPRLQLVPAKRQDIKAIAESIAKAKRAPGTRPRDEGETA